MKRNKEVKRENKIQLIKYKPMGNVGIIDTLLTYFSVFEIIKKNK